MTTPAALIDRLIHTGEVIAHQGVRAADVDLLLIAHDARDLGVQPVLVDLMVDEKAPAVVRTRAFARVASVMSASAARGARRPQAAATPHRVLAVSSGTAR